MRLPISSDSVACVDYWRGLAEQNGAEQEQWEACAAIGFSSKVVLAMFCRDATFAFASTTSCLTWDFFF
jgi:hypothetical protein